MALADESALLPMIQLSITPVILLTGLGSLLLTTTNRLGRIVDRTRSLAGQVRTLSGDDREHVANQLRILYRRAKLVRGSVTFTALAMFSAASLVVVIFLSALLKHGLSWLILAVFSASILFLLFALVTFTRDIFMSLAALGLEVDRSINSTPKTPAAPVQPSGNGASSGN